VKKRIAADKEAFASHLRKAWRIDSQIESFEGKRKSEKMRMDA
jgi:hypothetical protein